MSAIMNANIGLVTLNLLLLSVLVVAYARMLREVRTPLTWGLLAFAGILAIQSGVQLYFFATMMSYYAGGVEGLVLVQNLLATLASGFLLAVTWFPGGLKRASPAPERA